MKHLMIVLLLLAFFSQGIIAQKLIKGKNVPKLVKDRFDRTFKKAESVKWFEDDNAFVVKFLERGNKCEATIDRTGKIVMTKKAIPLKQLSSKIADDLRKNHKKLDPQEAYYIEKGRREKYYSIILHKSQGRKKPPLVYEIQYDKQSRFLTIYEPEMKEEEPEDNKDEKFLDDLDEDLSDLEEDVDYDKKLNKKDLPGPAVAYLDKKFDIEYRYKVIKLQKNKKYGEHYYVERKKQGDDVRYLFWFDTKGKLLKEKTKNE